VDKKTIKEILGGKGFSTCNDGSIMLGETPVDLLNDPEKFNIAVKAIEKELEIAFKKSDFKQLKTRLKKGKSALESITEITGDLIEKKTIRLLSNRGKRPILALE
jgi:hypothetical protein